MNDETMTLSPGACAAAPTAGRRVAARRWAGPANFAQVFDPAFRSGPPGTRTAAENFFKSGKILFQHVRPGALKLCVSFAAGTAYPWNFRNSLNAENLQFEVLRIIQSQNLIQNQ